MKINETKPVVGVGSATASEHAVTTAPKDRVTVSETRQARASITSIQASVSRGRPERLKDLEEQVRKGNYHPDPSQVAEQIMNDAEIDVRMQTILQH